MLKTDQVVRTYEDLAYIYDRQNQPRLRDWFLILAADAAWSAGWENEAERLRLQLLSYNPHHLLKPFASFGEALNSPDIEGYIADLRQNYPPETAEQMLENQRPSYLTSAREATENSDKKAEPAPAAKAEQQPHIYRMEKEKREAAEPPTTRTSPLPAAKTAPAPPPPRPAATRSTLAKNRKPSPLVQEWQSKTKAAKTASREEKALADEAGPVSRWLGTLLFIVILLTGAGLLAYTLIRPFLP